MKAAPAASAGLFLLLAAAWAFYDPFTASLEVGALSGGGQGTVEAEQALLRRGRGSIGALRKGAESPDIPIRLRSARLLALLGDDTYDSKILETLRDPRETQYALLAQSLVLSVWDQRNGPGPADAAGAFRDERRAEDWDRTPDSLDLLLVQYPAWASGYVLRAKKKLKDREVRAALDDAKAALHLEPEHFEAYILLGECYQLLGLAEASKDCFEKAVEINPHLQPVLRERLARARKEAAIERERRLLERQRELPIG